MAIERPDRETLTFMCDVCDETIDFSLQDDCAEKDGQPDFVACWDLAKADGWHTQKPVGYAWEHYCPTCAKLSEKDRIPRARDGNAS